MRRLTRRRPPARAPAQVIVVHNCKTVMEQAVMEHIFHSQIKHVYGRGKVQTTRIAAVNPSTGELEEKDVLWFKTDFSRHVILANEDCDLGDRTNGWAFALLKNWLRSAFVPVNRRFSVLQVRTHWPQIGANWRLPSQLAPPFPIVASSMGGAPLPLLLRRGSGWAATSFGARPTAALE